MYPIQFMMREYHKHTIVIRSDLYSEFNFLGLKKKKDFTKQAVYHIYNFVRRM